MIKAVIFDCFGVIAAEGWTPFRHKYFDSDPIKSEEARKIISASGDGYMTHEAFLQAEADLAGVSYEQARGEIENNPSNESLLKFIMEDLDGYKIGLLSNVSNNRLSSFMTKAQLARFDSISLSYEMGVSKPNAQAYEIAAQRLGVKPEECIFTDDRIVYCEGAERTGMKAILFQSTDQFIADFHRLIAESIDSQSEKY